MGKNAFSLKANYILVNKVLEWAGASACSSIMYGATFICILHIVIWCNTQQLR